MKKFWNVLKLIGILVSFVLLLAFLFFDIIDWIVPGSFPNWVYVTDIAVSALILVICLAVFIVGGVYHKMLSTAQSKKNRKQD